MECGNEHQSGRLEQLAESCLQLHNPEQSSRRFPANGGERQRTDAGPAGRTQEGTHTHDRAAWLHQHRTQAVQTKMFKLRESRLSVIPKELKQLKIRVRKFNKYQKHEEKKC